MKKVKINWNNTPFWHLNFAHRGLHDIKAGIPENSLAAFDAAAKAGYATEFDVRLTKDGTVVVFHDEYLKRMCGCEGRVIDKTWDEIKELKLAGTDQTIPRLEDVLRVLEKGKDIVILCELKAVLDYKDLCIKTLELLRTYKGTFCIESFNPFIVRWFLKNAPDVVRGQLATGYKENKTLMNRVPAWIFAHCYLTFFNKPNFIAYKNAFKRPKHVLRYCRKKGKAMLVAWTSVEPDIDQEENDAVIFEEYRPENNY